MLIIFLRAWVIALEIATGTSRALPKPNPTRPEPSPTTVRAVNPNWRPPLTTFAVRLTATSFSTNSSADWPFSALAMFLELQTRFAGRIGERLHAPVVLEPSAVKGNLADACRLRTFGDYPSDRFGGLDVPRSLQALGHGLLHGRSCGEHFRTQRIGHLRVDMARRAMHRQPGEAKLADVGARLRGAPQPALLLADRAHFFLPSLRVICSPA